MEIKPIVKNDFLVFDDQSSVSEMLGKLKQYDKRSGLVFRNKKYLGLVQRKRLFRSGLDLKEANIDHFVHKTPVLSENASVLDVAEMLYECEADFLPVEKNKVITGIVNSLDVVQLSLGMPEVLKLKIIDVPLEKSVKLMKDDPLAKAFHVMQDAHVDHLPVYEGNTLFGVVSYRDLFRVFLHWSPKRDVSARFNKEQSSRSGLGDISAFSSLPVSTCTTTQNLETIGRKQYLKDAVALLGKYKIMTLLVMDGTTVEGLLTVRNVLKTIAGLRDQQRYTLRYAGLHDLQLTDHQQADFVRIVEQESAKLERRIAVPFEIIVSLKEYYGGGKQHEFRVNLKVQYPGRKLTSEDESWDLEKALHKCFNAVAAELKDKPRQKDKSRQKKF